MDYKDILTGVAERLSSLRGERLSAGTKYRLMGMAADIEEVAETLSAEVLERVRHEAVLDVDADTDFDQLAEEVLSWELTVAGDDLQELTLQVNSALGSLSEVLAEISSQLDRRHKDEEYARLYEQEKRRYLSSGTPRRVRQTFDDWLYDVCNGSPSLEDINDFVIEKQVHMFEKGVFNSKVEHLQRASRYPDEFDFSLLDDDHKLKKTVHKHYHELRKLVDYSDGCLVVNPVKVGRHFYANRKEENVPEIAGSPVGKRGRGSAARRAGYRPGDEVLEQVAAGRLRRRALPAVARHDAQAGHVYCRCVLRQVTNALEVEAVSGTVAHQQSGAGEVGDAGDGQVALTFGRN